MKPDFSGWASKNGLRCADGLTIRSGAFSADDGKRVPLVWNHRHNSVSDVLGHAILENRDEGVYAYCYLNNTAGGRDAKESIQHGDVTSLSIWANNLEKAGKDVLHGVIREVSLVLAGANPGAFIESVMSHGMVIDEDEDEGVFYTGEDLYLEHAEDDDPEDNNEEEEDDDVAAKTVGDVYDGMTEEQKQAVAIMIGEALEARDAEDDDDEEDEEEDEMGHSIFENEGRQGENYLSHSDMEEIFKNAKRCGSLREAVHDFTGGEGYIAHAVPTDGMTVATGKQTYGFNDVDMFLPEYRSMNGARPEWIRREMTWVDKVLAGVHQTPFSRIKSTYANITEDEARAKGYIKGKQKKEEVFSTLKRTTDPQTIYKKQKLDRDDILDITDFDIVAWVKEEMRMMLNEEKARAILIGDGRAADSEDKIQEIHIRPIATDVPLFNTIIKVSVAADATQEAIAKATINAIIRARKQYKGSGTPTWWTTEDVTTEMLLIEDGIGHKLYKTEQELATTLRAKEIVPVEPMEGHKISIKEGETTKQYPLIGIMVNLIDYNVGKDPKADSDMFEDFDIDYNQYKYLLETRMSGALIKPFSALTVVLDQAAASKP